MRNEISAFFKKVERVRVMKTKCITKRSISMLLGSIALCAATLCITAVAGEHIRKDDMKYTVNMVAEDSEIDIIDSIPIGVGLRGDANSDDKVSVRDAALVANYLSKSSMNKNYMPDFANSLGGAMADANADGKLNIRDAATIARYLASNKSDKDWDNI